MIGEFPQSFNDIFLSTSKSLNWILYIYICNLIANLQCQNRLLCHILRACRFPYGISSMMVGVNLHSNCLDLKMVTCYVFMLKIASIQILPVTNIFLLNCHTTSFLLVIKFCIIYQANHNLQTQQTMLYTRFVISLSIILYIYI